MDIIPLTTIVNKKIQNLKLLEKLKEDELLYVIDQDGIEKDKSNFDIYQKLSKKYQLWVDTAPRRLGDVVDVFMTGAIKITLRKIFYSYIKLESIREISDNKIYASIDVNNHSKFFNDFLLTSFDGIILFYSRDELEKDFKKEEAMKNILTKYNTFIYENNKKNIGYWSKFKPSCFIVEISKYWEFKKNE